METTLNGKIHQNDTQYQFDQNDTQYQQAEINSGNKQCKTLQESEFYDAECFEVVRDVYAESQKQKRKKGLKQKERNANDQNKKRDNHTLNDVESAHQQSEVCMKLNL